MYVPARPVVLQQAPPVRMLQGLVPYHDAKSKLGDLGEALARVEAAWQMVRRGLLAIASGQPADAAIQAGLDGMQLQLKAWEAAHVPPQRSQLLFSFPRSRIGRELHQILKLGRSPQLVQRAAHVASWLQAMAITPQEEKMWQMFVSLEVEDSEPGVLGAQQSFGQHLHLRGGATGQIQLMQDWEWPYMFALADSGFQIALQNRSGSYLRILEIGWGQGISGRRLMGNAESAGVPDLRVHYEVVELHPQVASDAQRHAAARDKDSKCTMHVHQGPWQKIMPALPANSYDLVFYDPLNISPRYIGEQQLFESWGLPICVFEALQFYRLLKPGGVVVQYAISHRTSTEKMLQEQVAPLFRELRMTRIGGLRPEVDSSYVTTEEAADLFAPALIK